MDIDKGISAEAPRAGGVSRPVAGGGEGKTAPPRRAAAASPIEFRLDAASGVPTYLQLVHQVEHALRLGYLTPGDQLPRVRDVVAALAINPNTVLKAYKELETKGLAAGLWTGHVRPGHADPGRTPGADRAAPLPVGLADRRGRGRAGRGRNRGAVHQRATGFL